MQRKASAVWKGGLKDGKGSISAPRGVLNNTPYSFTTRFENAPGTNPEELIAAAHAGCFSMALSAQLGGANLTPESISTTVTLSLDKLDSGWTITASHIDVVGKVPGHRRGNFPEIRRSRRKGMPRLQSAQRQDHHERQTGVASLDTFWQLGMMRVLGFCDPEFDRDLAAVE